MLEVLTRPAPGRFGISSIGKHRRWKAEHRIAQLQAVSAHVEVRPKYGRSSLSASSGDPLELPPRQTPECWPVKGPTFDKRGPKSNAVVLRRAQLHVKTCAPTRALPSGFGAGWAYRPSPSGTVDPRSHATRDSARTWQRRSEGHVAHPLCRVRWRPNGLHRVGCAPHARRCGSAWSAPSPRTRGKLRPS